MDLDTQAIEAEYNAGTLSPEEKKAWEAMRDDVPMNIPVKADPDTFYSNLELRAKNGEATPRELATVKHAALNGEYVPKVLTFEDADGRKAIPGYARSDADSLLGDLGYQAEGVLVGAGKAFKNIGEEAKKLTGVGDAEKITAEQNARQYSDTALAAGRPVSSTTGQIAGELAATAPIGLGVGMGLRGLGFGARVAGAAAPLTRAERMLNVGASATEAGITGAAQGALAPTNDGSSRTANALMGGVVGAGLGLAVPAAIGLGRGAVNAVKAVGGAKTPVTQIGQEAIDASNAAGDLGIQANPAAFMREGGTARQASYSGTDAMARDIAQGEQQSTLRTAQQLGDELKATNAGTKFDNVDELSRLSIAQNPHSTEAEAALSSIAAANKAGTGIDIAQANMQGNLVMRKAQYADTAREVRDAAYNIPTTPTQLVDKIQEVSQNLDKIKTYPPAIKGEIEALQNKVGKGAMDEATGVTTYPETNVGDLMDSLQTFKARIRQLNKDGVISTRDVAELRPIEDAWNKSVNRGLEKFDPELAQRAADNTSFYAKEIAPFHDQTLADSIRTFGTIKAENAITNVAEDAQKFAKIAPLLGEKGKAALADHIFNTGLDDIMKKAGNTGKFSIKDYRVMLKNNEEVLGKVIQSPEQRDMMKGTIKVLDYISPGNRINAGSAGNRLATFGSTTMAGVGLGAAYGGYQGGSMGAVVGAGAGIAGVKALKFLSTRPEWREKLIRIGNLPPSSPAASVLKKQIASAIAMITNAELAAKRNGESQ